MASNIFPDNTMMNRGSYGGSDIPPELLPRHLASSSTAQNNPQAGQQWAAASQNNLSTGLTGALGSLQSGAKNAQNTLTGSGLVARQDINAGKNAAQAGLTGVANTIQAGGDQNLGFVNDTFNQGINPISGFINNGQQAQNSAANLLGLNGQEAFDASMINNPGTNFLAQEQERARLRNATAPGGVGVGGGRIRQQLQRDAFGRAQTDLNNQIAGLTNLSGQGLDAASNAGQLRGQQANIGSNVIGNTTGALADVGTLGAQLEAQTGVNLGQLQQSTGLNVAQVMENLGSSSAQVRSQAGRDLAAAVQSSSDSLANLQQSQGSGLADINKNQINDLRGQLTSAETQRADLSTRLSTLLGNLAVGQGTNQATIAQNVGNIEASGILGNSKIIGTSLEELSKLLGSKGFGL